jgi:hypothetical protein
MPDSDTHGRAKPLVVPDPADIIAVFSVLTHLGFFRRPL